jgi:hypothetical protein
VKATSDVCVRNSPSASPYVIDSLTSKNRIRRIEYRRPISTQTQKTEYSVQVTLSLCILLLVECKVSLVLSKAQNRPWLTLLTMRHRLGHTSNLKQAWYVVCSIRLFNICRCVNKNSPYYFYSCRFDDVGNICH